MKRWIVVVTTAVLTTSSVMSAGCAARRAATLPDLSPDADPTLVEPHAEAQTAYASCAESYNGQRIPWQLPVATATGGLMVLGLAGATATPFITTAVVPAPHTGWVGAVAVGVLALTAGVSAGATAYFGAQVPGQFERTRAQGSLLQIAEGRALEAATAEDGEELQLVAREIYEDCRAVQGADGAESANRVVRDFQRYRQESVEERARRAEVEAHRDEITKVNAELEQRLASKTDEMNAAVKRAEARNAAIEERIASLEGTVSEKQAETQSLRGEVDRLESEQALLSEEKKKLLDEKKKLEAKSAEYEGVAKSLEAELKNGKVQLRRLRNGVVVEMKNNVLFPSGKAELNEAGLDTLKSVANAIKTLKDKRIRIEGHTDAIPVGKNSEYASNWELSSARALAVTRYLQDLGVNPALMSAEARSQYAPAASNKNRTGRARNRRIEIYLVPQPAGQSATFKPEG